MQTPTPSRRVALCDGLRLPQAKMARDVNQLSGQIADLDRTITVERQAWAGERQKLELQIEDLVRAGGAGGARRRRGTGARHWTRIEQGSLPP